MKSIRITIANAKVRIAFFIYSHIVIVKDVKNVKNIIKRRKTPVLLNRCCNI